MATAQLPLILEPEQLLPLLGKKKLLIVDLSDEETHSAYHVPGAVHLSYAQLIKESPSVTEKTPIQAQLNQSLNQAGLTPQHHVIAYDNLDNSRACRLLWTLDLIGHTQHSLLNGGLLAWLDERHPTESGLHPVKPGQQHFKYCTDAPIADLLYLLQHLNDDDIKLLDARTPEEYSGQEIRSQRGGHIPGAVNLDHRCLVSPEHSMRLKPEPELRLIIKNLKLNPQQKTIIYCHTYRRAALLYIALKSLGFTNLKAYPGSWDEWGNNLDTPVK